MNVLGILLTLVTVLSPACSVKTKFTGFKSTLTLSDMKEWKKLLKTRNNVLTVFSDGDIPVKHFFPMFESVANKIKGKGSVVYVDCSSEAKKLCKNLKVKPRPYILRHYREGTFHKDYDRLMEEKSMYSFLEDPTADPPWSEDPSANHIRHVEGPDDLSVLLRTEKKPILIMFYAPWCGHCKNMKPHMAEAALEVKGRYVLAGMDANTPETFGVREQYNISGYPTLVYFENGRKKYDYAGGHDKEGLLEWLKDPQPPEVSAPPQQEEAPWSEVESDVVHLTTKTFDEFMETHTSVLIMFYAPWCGHCKAMKPAFMEAAKKMKEQEVGGVMAAVDATKERDLGTRYGVKGYPTIKYFGDGGVQYDYGYEREADDMVDFMRSPQPPPPPEKEWSEEESFVNHLTDENFKSSLKKKKHSLVMFYAPWCGHCKRAKPEFTSAAEEFRGDKKVSFAALDCTKFRALCLKYDIEGYPTFIYFTYGKNPTPYDGSGFSEFMANPSLYLHSEL